MKKSGTFDAGRKPIKYSSRYENPDAGFIVPLASCVNVPSPLSFQFAPPMMDASTGRLYGNGTGVLTVPGQCVAPDNPPGSCGPRSSIVSPLTMARERVDQRCPSSWLI